MSKTIEFDAILTQYKELYNHDCPDGIRYAGWEVTLLFDRPPRLEGTDFKVAFTPVATEPAPEPDPFWHCAYCGQSNAAEREGCRGCQAPKGLQ